MTNIDQQIKNWLHSLHDHDPGDLRGLAAGLAKLLELLAQKLPAGPKPAPNGVPADDVIFRPFSEAKREFEREYIANVLRICQGNVCQAASLAQKDRKDFYDVMHRCGIDPEAFRNHKGGSDE